MASKSSRPVTSASPATGRTQEMNRGMDYRVKSYALAAAAAGVSMMALTQPAESEVVITKKNIPITPVTNNYTTVQLDLNKDGVVDLSFSLEDLQYHLDVAALDLNVYHTGAAVQGAVGAKGGFYASALMRGAKIGPSAHFGSLANGEPNALLEQSYIPYNPFSYSRQLTGKWAGNPPNRYLGVKFLIDGETHYGWVRITVTSTRFPMSADITAYAYETIANKPLAAGIADKDSAENAEAGDEAVSMNLAPTPQTSQVQGPSLGILALGANGLKQWKSQ